MLTVPRHTHPQQHESQYVCATGYMSQYGLGMKR